MPTTDTVTEIPVYQLIPDDMLVKHLNERHAYTIPADSKQLEKPYIIAGLHREHAARHVQQAKQEHIEAARWSQDKADAFFDARAYRDGVR